MHLYVELTDPEDWQTAIIELAALTWAMDIHGDQPFSAATASTLSWTARWEKESSPLQVLARDARLVPGLRIDWLTSVHDYLTDGPVPDVQVTVEMTGSPAFEARVLRLVELARVPFWATTVYGYRREDPGWELELPLTALRICCGGNGTTLVTAPRNSSIIQSTVSRTAELLHEHRWLTVGQALEVANDEIATTTGAEVGLGIEPTAKSRDRVE